MGQDSLKPAFSKASFFKFIIEYLQLSQAIILSLGLFYITDVSWVSSFTNGNIIISSLLLFQFVWLVFSWKWYSQQDWFNLYTIFLVACFCFNASQSTLFLFGLLDNGILDSRFSDVRVIQSLYFVLVSFSWLHLGALLGWGYASQQCGCIRHINITYSSIRFVSILLIFLAFPFVLYMYWRIIRVVMGGGYFAIYQVDKSTGFLAIDRVLSAFLVPAALFLLATSRNNRGLRWLAAGILISNILANLFIGHRGYFMMDTIATLWVWHRSIKKIPLYFAFIGAVCILVVFNLVYAMRNIPGAERLTLSVWITALHYVDNPIVASIKEMGGSLRTLVYTLELVPLTRPFAYGGTYFWAITTLIPNLFWDVHPAVTAKAADWLVETVNPAFAAIGGGYGYSIFAEGYLNFGWLGSILPMLIIGFLITKLLRWESLYFHPAKVGVVASFFSMFIWIARGESISIVRQLFWYSLFPLLLMILCNEVFRVVFKDYNGFDIS